ncbi:MAG: hypothetical protein HY013_10990 [Candidatus Solibacter usitatus]|nr:hypothetical protein [Candidatus Solibacter usitatus]
MRAQRAAFVLSCAAHLLAAGGFLGPSGCTECHPGPYQRQVRSRHALALRPIRESPLAQLLVGRTWRERGDVTLEYQASPGGLGITAHKNQESASAVLEWAFGAGAQGITPVGRLDGRYFEHRFSWYRAPDRPALTFGHPAGPSPDPGSALGVAQSGEVIYRCFQCHATGVNRGPDLSAMIPGVTCERCHGPGRAHAEAARAGKPGRHILNPGRFPAKAQVEICGDCHRLPKPGDASPAPELEDPITVRFQPIGFLASRCFTGSRNFSCLTCHDPHEDARPRNDAFYSSKCLACHSTPARARSTCPRAPKKDCLPCHMQRASPAPHLTFTDHRIRVYPAAR